MHTSLYEAQTDDRGNKNDINRNTHSSMNPLMQNATVKHILSHSQTKAALPCGRWEERHQHKNHGYFIIQHYGAVVGCTLTCEYPGHDDKKAHCKNSKNSWSNGMKNKNPGLLLVGMWANIFLIGRALYLAVREAVKSGAVPRRRGAQLAGLLLVLELWYMRLL